LPAALFPSFRGESAPAAGDYSIDRMGSVSVRPARLSSEWRERV
jgi:hypothetical protein